MIPYGLNFSKQCTTVLKQQCFIFQLGRFLNSPSNPQIWEHSHFGYSLQLRDLGAPTIFTVKWCPWLASQQGCNQPRQLISSFYSKKLVSSLLRRHRSQRLREQTEQPTFLFKLHVLEHLSDLSYSATPRFSLFTSKEKNPFWLNKVYNTSTYILN